MELLVGGQDTVIGALERIAAMAFAEGGKLGAIEDQFEDLVAEFEREGEEGWVHGWLLAAVNDGVFASEQIDGSA